ncbi:hypothetical protein WBG78_28580 [Chryseolinea sp. T2]|uniref:hypothetical protein n=1 Tax=Chryseolinea sp. T2 TaxID=3129255 RepID=UPI0030771EBE
MDYDIDILSPEYFRLKSSRRRERWKRRDREKTLLRLYREIDALRKQRRDLGWERLDEPVMRGYKRYFVLRADVAKSKEAKFFQGILDRINTTEYSSRRDFKKKRRRGGRKMYEVRSQEVEKLWTDAFRKRKFTEQEASYFDLVMTDERPESYFRWMYVFREPWRFQLKIEPNIIRWTMVKDFDLERRIGEIDRYIDGNHLWPTILRLVRGGYKYRGRYARVGELPKYSYDPFRNRTFAEILDEYWPDARAEMKIEKPSDDEGFSFIDKSSYLRRRALNMRPILWHLK